MSEPPLRFGQNEPPADLADRLQALVDQAKNEEAVLLFLREDVGMPEAAIKQVRASPAFAGMVPLAQTTVYDNRLVASVSTPTAAMLGVDVPTTILRGDPTMPLIVTAVERLAAAMPGTELVVVPESHDHGVDPAGTVREVRARIGGPSSSAPQNRSMEIRDRSSLAATLEGVREQTKDGLVHWRHRGRLVARQLDDEHVVVRTEFEARDVLGSLLP